MAEHNGNGRALVWKIVYAALSAVAVAITLGVFQSVDRLESAFREFYASMQARVGVAEARIQRLEQDIVDLQDALRELERGRR